MVTIYETSDFENMQTTSLYQHNALKSNEINRLIENIGVGKNYIASNFDISFIVSDPVSGDNTTPILYAVLTPGIIVQDYTVINFQDEYNKINSLNPYDKTINVELLRNDVASSTSSGYSVFIGCSYYHGTYGDAINSSPTYASIIKLRWIDSTNKFGLNNKHFIPYYKITFNEGYRGINDTTNIIVERVIPHIKYDGVGQPVEAYKTSPENLSVYGGDIINDDGDAGLLWAVVL